MLSLDGLTFQASGPNCFATALYAVGGINKFRGVSANEFSHFTKQSCVEVETPKYGDIGYYYVDGFGPSHAFFYLYENRALEKPGVDYFERTSLSINKIKNIHYIRIATPECRRWGDETCFSEFKYVRCSKAPKSSNNFRKLLYEIESLLHEVLVEGRALNKDSLLLIEQLKKASKNDYELAVLESIIKQINFL